MRHPCTCTFLGFASRSVIAFATLLLFPLVVCSQPMPHPHGRDNAPPHVRERIQKGFQKQGPGDKLGRLFQTVERLHLSDQQLIDLRKSYQNHHGLVASLGAELRANHKQIAEFMKKGTDRAAGRSLARKQGELITRLLTARMDLQADLHRILTPEQQTLLSAHKRFGGQKNRFGGRNKRFDGTNMPWQQRPFPPHFMGRSQRGFDHGFPPPPPPPPPEGAGPDQPEGDHDQDVDGDSPAL